MAQAYGSSFDQLPEKLSDEIDITYDGMVYRVAEAHRYAITSIGDDLRSLARSSYGHEIIKHKKKPQRGFQFHPEAHMESTDGERLLSLVTGIGF
jgi:anthranilate/para-aminobenzoate synthase component II